MKTGQAALLEMSVRRQRGAGHEEGYRGGMSDAPMAAWLVDSDQAGGEDDVETAAGSPSADAREASARRSSKGTQP